MNGPPNDAMQREALRQQLLLRTLLRDAGTTALGGWVRQGGGRRERAVAAYRANASASAERALASAYPTVQAMLGEDSFARLARAAWRQSPPQRGDLAEWSGSLPQLLADNEDLREWPYLADAARLDWAVHRAGFAADAPAEHDTLHLLASREPEAVRLVLCPSLALLRSAYPIATIWAAHHAGADFSAVREALAAQRGEAALVYRTGWRVQVTEVDEPTARCVQALLRQQTLSAALDAAGTDFDFQDWLARALQLGWLWRVAEVAARRDDRS